LALWFLALGGTRAEGSTPRNATATASVVFGFVVNVQITDGGAGYLHTPAVGFSGGGGANAAAYAVMVGGVVTSIVITNAGYGYTNAPTVLITPAPKNTSLNVVRAPMLVVEGEPDYVVQLQYSDAVGTTNWTTITNMVLSSNRFVWADTTYPTPTNRFYRANTTSGDIPILNPNPSRLVWIRPGSFTMGSPLDEPSRAPDETLHPVMLTKGFFMGKFEVTQGEYALIMGTTQSTFTGDPDFPVDNAGWDNATNYCGRFAELERLAGRLPNGWAYRLPTEAEWEYACRAGTTTAYAFGVALSPVLANFNFGGGAPGRTTKGGTYPPNAWGLYDMHGNVWEWCLDGYTLYPNGGVTDPVGPIGAGFVTYRGGCWYFDASLCRSAQREYNFNSGWAGVWGFRIVLARPL